jgi:secernin
MCDVLVALADATKNGSIIFGKNSDRPAGECQVLHFAPAGQFTEIECSYLKLSLDRAFLATMGCRPYWCWGYETAVNEAGVVGGNTAVFTKQDIKDTTKTTPGLSGMELLRLGLSLDDTAEGAMNIIIEFLEKHGQWGSAIQGKGHEEGTYDNAYLLVDRDEAWVLETAGKHWIAERIESGIHSISNELTIRTKWTKSSEDIEEHAANRGWWNLDDGKFDFARAYSDHEHYSRQVSHIRLMRSRQLLNEYRGTIDTAVMMRMLRDHYETTFLKGPSFHQFLPDFHTICMHNSPSGFTWGNTATSVIVELNTSDKIPPPLWLCYLPPCMGIYNVYPFSPNTPLAVTNPGRAGLKVRKAQEAPQDTFDEGSLWWRFSRILDAVLIDPTTRLNELKRLLGHIEEHNLSTLVTILTKPPDVRENELCRFAQKEVEAVLGVLSLLEERWLLL